jgi:outer membrane receptor protein involved in Fe transport
MKVIEMKAPLILIILISCIQTTFSQKNVDGIILNRYSEPVADAYIFAPQRNIHTHSDSKGRFSIEGVDVGDSLWISHIGYQSQVATVTAGENELRIILNEKPVDLSEVRISPQVNALNTVVSVDLKTNPVNSSQDVLRTVPGLFIGQHAGGGKAEQIFLRGFDIDHGTDLQITVDDLPVNMVSHAHGQGYADLHFLIPETIEDLDFGKGPYATDRGNFSTAGYVNFETKKNLERSMLKLEYGQFNTRRILGMFNLLNTERHSLYVASELLGTDGPFESPQNFSRINFFARYSGALKSNDRIGVTASYFSSKWDASGQIPQRAVDDGTITRFGAIDDTEGGYTSRSNFAVEYDKMLDQKSFLKNKVYFVRYDFELYSNFTFFLNDPIHGDQIRQKESRNIIGFLSEYNRDLKFGGFTGVARLGLNIRADQIQDNELSNTVNRKETLNTIQFGDIYETNSAGYFDLNLNYGKLTVDAGIRYDHFRFEYVDALQTLYSNQNKERGILSPKLSFLYTLNSQIQFYLKSGKSFHSNDTRVILEGENNILPAAYGTDLGIMWKPFPRLFLNAAYWYLYLEQEFVYVGDAGVVEPSGRTQRQGIDLSIRYQPLDWLFWNLDATYTYARSIDEENGENYIPLAPDFTLTTALLVRHHSGLYGSVNLRFLDDRPANEDNSIVAIGYTVVDLSAGYSWKRVSLGFQIQNLFDTEWNETQFATESRLRNEIEPVEEIHFTPGTSFFLRGILTYSF